MGRCVKLPFVIFNILLYHPHYYSVGHNNINISFLKLQSEYMLKVLFWSYLSLISQLVLVWLQPPNTAGSIQAVLGGSQISANISR